MTKEKLLSVVKRVFRPSFDNLAPQACYLKFVSEFPFTELAKAMNADDRVMFSFLLPHGNKPEVMSELYDVIKSSIFGFTVMEIDEEEPSEDCSDCNGDGREYCYNCGGSGEADCYNCDGEGEDEEGNSCDNCEGRGKVDCDECNGSGNESCSTCDGDGYVVEYGTYAITQYFTASYDRELFQILELKEENDHIKIKLQTSKTITLLKKETILDDNNDYDERELYFIELTDSPDFRPSDQTNRVDINNLPDVGR